MQTVLLLQPVRHNLWQRLPSLLLKEGNNKTVTIIMKEELMEMPGPAVETQGPVEVTQVQVEMVLHWHE